MSSKAHQYKIENQFKPDDIHVDGKGDVVEHDEDVGYGDAGEDSVDGSSRHVLACQDSDVQRVRDSAKHTHQERCVPVHVAVRGGGILQPVALRFLPIHLLVRTGLEY